MGFDFMRLLAGEIGLPDVVTGTDALVDRGVDTDSTTADTRDGRRPEMLAENPAQTAIVPVVVVLGLVPVRSETSMVDGDERPRFEVDNLMRHEILVIQGVAGFVRVNANAGK